MAIEDHQDAKAPIDRPLHNGEPVSTAGGLGSDGGLTSGCSVCIISIVRITTLKDVSLVDPSCK